jgi:hypothetical protein
LGTSTGSLLAFGLFWRDSKVKQRSWPGLLDSQDDVARVAEGTPSMTQAAPGAGPQTENRASHRVHIAFRLEISGTDTSGRMISERARTEVITRDGGLMICAASLPTGSHFELKHLGNIAHARIVGAMGIRGDEIAYGIAFLDTSGLSFWGVEFPPPDEAGGAGRAVLECGRCGTQQVFELSEVEMMVLESVRVVSHDCQRCADETLWQVPVVLSEPDFVVSGSSAVPSEAADKGKRTRNDRKHQRLSMKRTRACIRRLGQPEDVVDVIDVSRGGVSFQSWVDYQPKAYIEIAVPYTEGGANVFTPARIARVKVRARMPQVKGEYGCQYEKRN